MRTLDEDGRILAEAPMAFAGETSIFEGTVAAAGAKNIEVVATQPDEANFGRVAAALE